jgi:hypothetical protein
MKIMDLRLPISDLWSMAYCSRMSTPLSDDALAGLAIHAAARNRTLGIVGVLFVAGNRFLQVLEGERGSLLWLYSQIAEDTRHRRVTRLMDMPIQQRAFTGWSMRLICETDLAASTRLSIVESLESASFLDSGEEVRLSRLDKLRKSSAVLVDTVLGRGLRDGRLPTSAISPFQGELDLALAS